MSETHELIWAGRPEGYTRAKREHKAAYHSAMLSVEISYRRRLVALPHIVWLWWHFERLTHTQRDILLSALEHVPRWFPQCMRRDICRKAERAADLLAADGDISLLRALAYMHCAFAALLVDGRHRKDRAHVFAREALKYVQSGDPRQCVRVLRKAGEIAREVPALGDPVSYWNEALALAEGEADTPVQARRIRMLMLAWASTHSNAT
jgi:hypothetical protein